MNIFVLSEKLVSLGLFTLFAFKAVVSVMKFNEGKVGTIQYTVDEPNMLYPSIAACVLPRNWSVAATPAGKEAAGINFLRGVDYAFESLVFIEYSLTVGNGSIRVHVNRPNVTKIVGRHLTPFPFFVDYPVGCFYFDPPGPSPTGLTDKVKMRLNLTLATRIYLFVYNRGQVVLPNFSKIYGSAFKLTDSPGNSSGKTYGMSQIWEIQKTGWKFLSAKTQGQCDDDSRAATLMECVEHWIDRELACRRPWRPTSMLRTTCNTSAQYERLKAISASLSKKDERGLEKMSGCRPSCQRGQFELATTKELRTSRRLPANTLELGFLFSTGVHVFKEQYVIYDGNSAFADIGGYLGLLLGHSLLSMYASGSKVVARLVGMQV